MSEMEYFEHEGEQYVRVSGVMTRTHHVRDQEALNRALEPLDLAPLGEPYHQQFDFGGYRAHAQLPGPARALLVDDGPPFQQWEWSRREYVWLSVDIEAELPRIFHPSTWKGARLVTIDHRAFQATLAVDEAGERFHARLDGYLRDTVALSVHIVAPSQERRDQIVSGIASIHVVASPDTGA